jgi:hypothetical protein
MVGSPPNSGCTRCERVFEGATGSTREMKVQLYCLRRCLIATPLRHCDEQTAGRIDSEEPGKIVARRCLRDRTGRARGFGSLDKRKA